MPPDPPRGSGLRPSLLQGTWLLTSQCPSTSKVNENPVSGGVFCNLAEYLPSPPTLSPPDYSLTSVLKEYNLPSATISANQLGGLNKVPFLTEKWYFCYFYFQAGMGQSKWYNYLDQHAPSPNQNNFFTQIGAMKEKSQHHFFKWIQQN